LSTSSNVTAQPAATPPLLSRPLILLSLLALLYHTEATSSLALGPVFSQDFHLTNVQVALVTNAAVLFSALLAIPLALFVDAYRRARIPLLVLGMLVWGGLTGLRGTASGFLTLLGLCAPAGIGLASSSAPSNSYLYDVFPSRLRSRALGILGAGQAAGTFVGFLLPGILIRYLSWHFLYFGFAACALILFIPLSRLREPVSGTFDEAYHRLLGQSWWQNLRESTRLIVRSRGAMVGIVGFSAQAFGIGGIATFLTVFLVRYYASSSANADSLVAGVVLALVLGTVLGGFVDTWLGHRFGVSSHTLVAGAATLALGLLFGLAVELPSLFLFLLLSVICGMLLGVTTAPLLALIGDMVGTDHRSYAYALQVTATALCQALGALAVGSLADLFLSLRLALLLFSGIIIIIGGWIAAQSQHIAHTQEMAALELRNASAPPKPLSMTAFSTPSTYLAPGHIVALLNEQGRDQAQAIEAAAQNLGADTSVWFVSPRGFRVLIHPNLTSQPGWLFSHILPKFGMSSIPIPTRLAGIRLALQDDHAVPLST
jgi:MFS family permease